MGSLPLQLNLILPDVQEAWKIGGTSDNQALCLKDSGGNKGQSDLQICYTPVNLRKCWSDRRFLK